MIIRRIPEDFAVVEHLVDSYTASVSTERGYCQYALYQLRKTSLTTPQATAMLAKLIGYRASSVQHAGLKDKHAVTTQHVTVGPVPAGAPVPPTIGGGQISARLAGYVTQPIDARAIQYNAFVLVVRSADKSDYAMVQSRLAEMSVEASAQNAAGLLVSNYFGDQRFGSARHGEGFAAARAIKGDALGALKLMIATPARKDTGPLREFTRMAATQWGAWAALADALPPLPQRKAIGALARGATPEQALSALPPDDLRWCVEAYQSWLWNKTAARVVADLAVKDDGAKAWTVESEYGDMLFVPARVIPAALHGATLPTFGPGLLVLESWGSAARAVLGEEGISPADLTVPGIPEMKFGIVSRPLFARVGEVSLSAAHHDELGAERSAKPLKFTLKCTLPKGCYATVLLRAFGQ